MTSISQAAIAASVIVGMISIPTVSQSAISQNPETQQIPDMNQPDAPREVSRINSADGFHATINTAMNDFSTYVSSESANATLESSTSNLEVSRSADEVEWSFQTPEGRLEITQTSTKTVQVTETSEGTLKQVQNGGTVKTSFKGSDRQKVEEARSSLKQKMEEKKQQLNQKRKELKDSATPEIQVVLNESTASGYENNTEEHVILINQEPGEIELDGWKIQNDNPDTYEFKDVVIEPGEKLKVYSSDADEIEDSGEAVTGTGLTWSNSEDTATLINDKGTVISSEKY